jgi:pyrroloquinoline quinone biosynthesis protein B
MRVRVLGSAAGGGVPQWNCRCPNCQDARQGGARVTPRTQDSLAISEDGEGWYLLNASPDIRQQIEGFAPLRPRGPRHSPIRAILLTDGELDHCLGLFSLRESHPLLIYSTERVRQGLAEHNAIFRTLQRFPGQVTWRILKLGSEEDLSGRDGLPSGLSVAAHPVPGKIPFHLADRLAPDPEDSVGLWIRERATGRLLVCLPCIRAINDEVRRQIEGADCLCLDGTFGSSDELVRLGLSARRAEDMGHLPIGGPGGSLAGLGSLAVTRKVYTHINNTNPILPTDSPERRAVQERGWEVAEDGLEIRL